MKCSISPTIPFRFCGIPGYESRVNDIVYCSPLIKDGKDVVTIFFGGDVQDFTENMKSHRDNKNYIKYNLENTAQIIQSSFPSSHIVIVKPSRMEYKTFSYYENFVPCTNCGAPEHTSMHYGLHHLVKLLTNVSQKLRTLENEELKRAMILSKEALVLDDTENVDISSSTDKSELLKSNDYSSFVGSLDRTNLHLENLEMSLIAFSKGCVVLNQFIYEFHYFTALNPENREMKEVISRIKHMYWLDGGHTGGKNTWITSRPLLETFAGLGINVHIHVTPYQVEDHRRPWIKKEEKTFSDNLRRLGVSVDRAVHFSDVAPTLSTHFNLLSVFKKDATSVL